MGQVVNGCDLCQITHFASVHYTQHCPWLTPQTLFYHNGNFIGYYLNQKGWVAGKGLSIFHIQITFMYRRSVTFDLWYWCDPVPLLGIQSLALWKSFWVCSVYPEEALVCLEKVNYSHFIFWNDVTSPLYIQDQISCM